MKKIKLISEDGLVKIETYKFFENFFLKKGFKKINFLHNTFFCKVRLLYYFLKNVEINLSAPPFKEIIILDTKKIEDLNILIPKEYIFKLPVRILDINKIYLSLYTILFIIFNLHHRSIKINYLISIVKQINPKKVITLVDNSMEFYFVSKYFVSSHIEFYAIQGACLRGTSYVCNENINKKVFIKNYLCFSEFEKKLFNETKAVIKNYKPIGSLKVSNFLNYVKKNKINFKTEKYDICLIGEPKASLSGDCIDVLNYDELPGILANTVNKICSKNNLKFILSGKNSTKNNSHLEEIEYYNFYFKGSTYKYLPKKNSYSIFENMCQSRLVIGHASTALREGFSLNKKILSCNPSGTKNLIFPVTGSCYIENFTEEELEKKILFLLSISYEEYCLGLDKSPEIAMKNSLNTSEELKKIILNFKK